MKLATLAVALGLYASVNCQNPNPEFDILETLFKTQKEVYFQFQVNEKTQLNQFSKIISVDGFNESTLTATAYASRKQFSNFIDRGTTYQILQTPSTLEEVKMWDMTERQAGPCNGVWDAYPTYSTYVDLMNQYASQYPDICEVSSIGTTPNGHELLVLKITDNLSTDEDEPEFLYTSTMHGDETSGYALMLHLIDHILCNYGSDQEVTDLVNNIEIYINPLANPDGAYNMSDNSVNGASRSNSNGIDLNRNYPDPETGAHPDGEVYQTETNHFFTFHEAHNFDISANLHSGAEVVNYPWDTWGTRHADDDWWQHVSTEFAQNAQTNSPNGYFTALNNGITNGNDWYEVDGGRQDYMNYNMRCREFTLEMSDDKTPNSSDLPDLWDYNKQAFLDYLKQSLYGIRGIVTDSITTDPLDAHIFILNHDVNNSDVYSHLPVGNYHRPIYSGTYTVVASADGYITKTITGVESINNQENRLDIQLVQEEFVGTNKVSHPEFSAYPNPSRDMIQILFNKLNNQNLSFEIIDITGKVVYSENIANQSYFIIRKMNISHFSSGIYKMILTGNSFIETSTFIKN